MKKWEFFYPYVLPDVPGCPDPLADQALVLAAREFCERTQVWVVDTDPTSTIIDISDYDFDTNAGQEVVKFVSATLNSRDLPVVAEGDLPSDWRLNMTQQRTCAFTQDRVFFTIVPTPSCEQDYTTKFIARPSLGAFGVDDRIFDQYAQQIAYGAISRLMLSANKPYTNAQLAVLNRGMFEEAVAKASLTQQRGHSQRRRRANALNF